MWKGTIFLIIFLSWFASAKAQILVSSPDTVVLDSNTARFVVGDITILGNKITHDRIITRELTFRKGDTLVLSSFESVFTRSEQNIFNTSLFNSVRINYLFEQDKVNLFIVVTERWYIFPVPVLEIADRNFNNWWRTKDFSRIIYGGVLTWNNFRGRNEELAITARFGYIQRFSFYYSVPFINKKQKAGLRFGFVFSRNHQTTVKTAFDDLVFYNDENLFTKREIGGSVAYNYRPNLYKTYSAEAGFKKAEVVDTIISLNNDYFLPGNNTIRYFSFRYFFKNDRRDIAFYPLNGYYFDAEIVRNGIPFLGDKLDMTYTTSHYRRFFNLGHQFYSGLEASGKYTIDKYVPYFLTRGLGYSKDFLRGYEYYVMDGKSFALLKSNFKFELLPKKELHAKFIPLNKFSTIPFAFYLNLFADAGYVFNDQFKTNNRLINSWQYSGGAGIDFVTYYDLVFRLEYSINKFGERGFFLHFTSSM